MPGEGLAVGDGKPGAPPPTSTRPARLSVGAVVALGGVSTVTVTLPPGPPLPAVALPTLSVPPSPPAAYREPCKLLAPSAVTMMFPPAPPLPPKLLAVVPDVYPPEPPAAAT